MCESYDLLPLCYLRNGIEINSAAPAMMMGSVRCYVIPMFFHHKQNGKRSVYTRTIDFLFFSLSLIGLSNTRRFTNVRTCEVMT